MAGENLLVVGVFQQESDAINALHALYDAGFVKGQIGLARNTKGVGTSSLFQDLVKLGVPEEDSRYYEREYNSGRSILSVRSDGRDQEAGDILQQHGASDREQTATAQTTANMAGEAAGDEVQSLHLREEQLQVDKQSIESGEVRLHKEVVEEPVALDVPVAHEEVFIQRRIIHNGRVSPAPIGQDETIRIPLLEEQVTIAKNAVETGEVVIGKRVVQEKQHVTESVRHEEARLDKEGNPRIHADEDLLHP